MLFKASMCCLRVTTFTDVFQLPVFASSTANMQGVQVSCDTISCNVPRLDFVTFFNGLASLLTPHMAFVLHFLAAFENLTFNTRRIVRSLVRVLNLNYVTCPCQVLDTVTYQTVKCLAGVVGQFQYAIRFRDLTRCVPFVHAGPPSQCDSRTSAASRAAARRPRPCLGARVQPCAIDHDLRSRSASSQAPKSALPRRCIRWAGTRLNHALGRRVASICLDRAAAS